MLGRRFALLLLAGGLALAMPAWSADMLIRGATVASGADATLAVGDVRVRGDRIVAVGRLSPEKGETVVDAAGLVLAPGFIDTHSHHADGLDKQPDALPVISQGVTTIVSGQDGGSELPVARFFADFTAHPAAINVASYSGHGTLRDKVMGADFKRAATPAEIDRMRALLDADMAAGALGLSTGLEYDPAIYASKDEVLALAKEAAKHGGRYISHMRSEDRALWEALDELVTIGREAKIPVQVSHAKLAMTDIWGQADRYLAVLDKARAEGIDATLDVYPYPNWQSTLTVLWPKRDFTNRETTDFVLKHLAPPEGILISAFTADPSLVGKTVAEIAKLRGTDPATTAMALIAEAEAVKGDVSVIATSIDERDIARLIAWPNANICSDGALNDLHPRGAGSFTKVLRHYVRETHLLTLGEAIHKMTGVAAQHMGFTDRGVIAPGKIADLVLFDPATVSDHATPADPGALSTGIARVWVAGELAFADGKATGAHPGRVIRREVAAK